MNISLKVIASSILLGISFQLAIFGILYTAIDVTDFSIGEKVLIYVMLPLCGGVSGIILGLVSGENKS